jgi:NAD(P)H-dependent nitrite reductase small subunit
VKVGKPEDFAEGAGEAVKYGASQLAVFHFPDGRWHCTQNMCPHQRAMVLSRGIIGDTACGSLKVSCPNHKKNFDVRTGKCLNDPEQPDLFTFETMIDADGDVAVKLPPIAEVDELLATDKWIVKSTEPSQCSSEGGCGGNKALEW